MTECALIVPSILPHQFRWFWEQNHDYFHHCQLVVIATFPLPAYAKQFFTEAHHLEEVAGTIPHHRWTTIPKPLGFAKTVNLGISTTQLPWVGTCNDDVVLCSGWEKMISNVRNYRKIAAINPIIQSMDGGIESAGISVLPQGRAVPNTVVKHGARPFNIQAFNGACVVFSRAFLDDLGGFDESFNSYLEDIELSLRAKRNGWQILLDPSITVAHVGHATTTQYLGPKKAWLDAVNWWRIVLRYTTVRGWLHCGLLILMERARNASGVIKAYGRYLKNDRMKV